MKNLHRVRYQMFVRVRGFGEAHRGRFPASSTAGKAFAAVDAVTTEMETHAVASAREDATKAKAVVRAAILERLAAVARTARLVAASTPDDDPFRLQMPRSDVALLATAEAFIQEGSHSLARYTALGMSKTVIPELRALVRRFELIDRENRAERIPAGDGEGQPARRHRERHARRAHSRRRHRQHVRPRFDGARDVEESPAPGTDREPPNYATCCRSRRFNPSRPHAMITSWFHSKAGRAMGARARIQRFVASTSQS